jgi:hypothetical protein
MITIGTPIIYSLSAADAEKINRRRTDGPSIADRMRASIWPAGAQAHIGNPVSEGQRFPGVVVAMLNEDKPNLQVWLDGSDCYWVTSAEEDGSKQPKPGTFARN